MVVDLLQPSPAATGDRQITEKAAVYAKTRPEQNNVPKCLRFPEARRGSIPVEGKRRETAPFRLEPHLSQLDSRLASSAAPRRTAWFGMRMRRFFR